MKHGFATVESHHFAKGLALSSSHLQNGERKLHAVFA
jgi:hypothetical protein